MADETKDTTDGTTTVTVELRVNGRRTPRFAFRQFVDKAEVPPAVAEQLVRQWLQLRATEGGK